MPPTVAPLAGRIIAITADRKSDQQAALFAKRGAEVLHGPTMSTVDLSRHDGLRTVTRTLVDQPPDYLVATTGMGMRLWLDAARDWGLGDRLIDALRTARILARGAKSASAVTQAGLAVWWQAPGERMDDVLERLAAPEIASARVAVQLFDAEDGSIPALRRLVGELIEVPVYRWLLPEDLGPARQLITAVLERRIDAITFTSQPAVHFLFLIAEQMGRADDLRRALEGSVLVACIGPVCAEAMAAEGVTSSVWPDPPRLPAMVRLVEEELAGLL